MKKAVRILLILAALMPCGQAAAQVVAQTLTLRQGWNAVFLQVQPDPADCDALFAAVPIESVWAWNKRFTPVQYIQDPNTLLPGQPDWLTYVRPTDPGRAAANLFRLQGGKAYLFKTTSATTLVLRGRPVIRDATWLAESFNLVGFPVSSNSPPNFLALLSPSPTHSGQPIYRLSAAGAWQPVISPSTTPVVRGESYWIRSAGYSSYPGFFQVTFEQGGGLDFGRVMTEQTLQIRNTSSNSTTFTLARLASGAPATTNSPAVAGEVPLSYWQMNLSVSQAGFLPLPTSLSSPAIPPGGIWTLRLAVRRADMASFALPPGYNNATYQTVLRLTDTLGSETYLPVSSDGLRPFNSATVNPDGPSPGPGAPVDPRAGLWVGSVALTGINQAAVSDIPVPAASEFQFRVLLHVDYAGTARLLQKAVLAWTNGAAITNDLGFRQAVSAGRFALLTDDALIAKFSGSALRDGNVTGRRIASAAFSFGDPILATRTGEFGQSNTLVSCIVPLGFDDPLNPFTHRYHPDHNNMDDRYETTRQESPGITRQIVFRFNGQDPDNTTVPGWGDNQLGGIYTETIIGLHKSPVKVEGTFRLYRAASVPVLNDLNF